jgi:hypothetical protein
LRIGVRTSGSPVILLFFPECDNIENGSRIGEPFFTVSQFGAFVPSFQIGRITTAVVFV